MFAVRKLLPGQLKRLIEHVCLLVILVLDFMCDCSHLHEPRHLQGMPPGGDCAKAALQLLLFCLPPGGAPLLLTLQPIYIYIVRLTVWTSPRLQHYLQ